MIDLQTANYIHDILIRYGGSKGIRDLGGSAAALSKAYETFERQLYPSAIDKAPAIFESMIIDHPCTDGNKRIAYLLIMRSTLLDNDVDLRASQAGKYEMTVPASKGIMRFDEVKHWLSERINKMNQ
ncbi:MAG: type toxin-antitoxin system death-on-curing family toxin [Mucilaginibacter sp.]|nr:type toxin-antitoxin system death-on-curing family toxin [Mucilaginibacter sp.]